MSNYIGIYLRTSTNKQETGLESQRRALIQECQRNSILEPREYSDEGVSGAKAQRPGLDALMDDIRAGLIKTVVVYSFSRFARSTNHLLSAMEEFRTLGVQFQSVTERIDTSSPMGKCFFVLISAIAELEKDLIRERIVNGLKNARAKGKRLGRKPIHKHDLMRDLVRKGSSYREIAKLAGCSISTVHRAVVPELKARGL